MYKKMRLLGAFFLFFASLIAQAADQGVNYSISPLDHGDKKIVIINSSNSFYPLEVVDTKEKSIRYINTGSEAIPIAGLIFSLFSVFFSVFIPIFLNEKNKNDSVLDDFWARQVFYPDYFKPFLDYSYWVKRNINNGLNESTLDEWNNKYIEILDKYDDLRIFLEMLSIEFKYDEFLEKHESIQDSIGKYTNLLIDNQVTFKVNGKEIIQSLSDFMVRAPNSNKDIILNIYLSDIKNANEYMRNSLLRVLMHLQGKKNRKFWRFKLFPKVKGTKTSSIA